MNKSIAFLIITFSLSITTALGTSWWFLQYHQPSVVSFNVKETLNAYHQSLVEKRFSADEQTKRLVQFTQVMNQEVADYQTENNAIVLVSAAVVSGSQDITPLIQRRILTHYNTLSNKDKP